MRISTFLRIAIGKPDRQHQFHPRRLGRVESKAVALAFNGHVADEGVIAIGPPEPGPVVAVEPENLTGQWLARERLHRQVVIQNVFDLGPVLQEEAMTRALVTDAITNDQGVGPVNRDPSIGTVPDRGSDHRCPAHRVADPVKMEAVLAQFALLAEMAEFRVGYRSGRVAMVHGVPAITIRVGRLDDHVALRLATSARRFLKQVWANSRGASRVSFVPLIARMVRSSV